MKDTGEPYHFNTSKVEKKKKATPPFVQKRKLTDIEKKQKTKNHKQTKKSQRLTLCGCR